MRSLLAIIFTLSFTSCATTAHYETALSKWKGSHIDNLVIARGVPQSTHLLSDGRKIVQYSSSSTKTTGGGSRQVVAGYRTDAYGYTETVYKNVSTPVRSVTYQCTTRFFVNANGIVESWDYKGNACAAYPPKST